jgi:hypothetical protein
MPPPIPACSDKVTRSALQHAASVAAMFLTTEAVVATIPEKDQSEQAYNCLCCQEHCSYTCCML